MCNGFKVKETLYDFGIKVEAIRCVLCATYTFDNKIVEESKKCDRHQVMYCGICERVQKRRDAKRCNV